MIEMALGREPLRILEQSPRGISVVLDPTCTPLGEALCRDEGILYAEIDLAQSVEPKQFHDVVGYYNRFDIFTLSVDRSARRPATFIDEARGSARQHRGMGSKTRGRARRLGARAAQIDDPLRAGRPRSRGEHQRKSGLAAWFDRLFRDLDRHLCVLAAAPLVAVFLVSVLPAVLLFWICQEVSASND
jgi:hypothetical protein